jgi:hypothetical protein
MKMLIIGFVALACMGTNKADVELYLAGAKEIVLEPLEQQRRIGKIDLLKLYQKQVDKGNHVKQKKSISAIENPAGFDSLKTIRSLNAPGESTHPIQDKQVFSKILIPAENFAKKGGATYKIINFFDKYGIPGGVVGIILLFAGIRYSMKKN